MPGKWPESDDPTVFQIGIREMNKDSISEPGKVWQRVQDIFTQFCQAGNVYKRASALWLTSPVAAADIQPREMVVYLVKNHSVSLIDRKPLPNIVIGLTRLHPTHLSEVYYDHPFLRDEPIFLANIIIHELMHNKLNMGNEMHDLAPFAGAAGGFLQDTMPDINMIERMLQSKLEPTGTDIRTMAPALPRVWPQFLG
jgi:hypothetical protein